MSGVKGQKWGTERPEARVKQSISLKPELYKKIMDIASEKRWSFSATNEYLLEQHFKSKK